MKYIQCLLTVAKDAPSQVFIADPPPPESPPMHDLDDLDQIDSMRDRGVILRDWD
ncbi:hypothetical protein PILCRDRAFT_9861 [Piloderma croceum F 1598]|uniref:Uncharacterized protein n=1 Tax=Piloderma croceum (strain F 1598) TaxID=765440 RepID=A0A0C3B181_PILCF|nr:hypothetical protein PILCRDRAFT_9861 [Piloderma croceum F 1598]